MKRVGISVAVLLAVTVLVAPLVFGQSAQTRQWQLDSTHSSVNFKISHLGTSSTWGRFDEFTGQFTTGTDASFDFTVATASINTNNGQRDIHLRNADFFNAKQFPVITFKSTAVTANDAGYAVTGDLTLHGATQSITVQLDKVGESDTARFGPRIGFDTTFKIKRSDFGMNNMLDLVGDEVTLMIALEGMAKK